MTPERAKELLPVIQGFAEGKTVQIRLAGDLVWYDTLVAEWKNGQDYRLKPEKKVMWVNVYEDGLGGNNYLTKEMADRTCRTRRVACIRIEYEEGEGL